MNAVAQEIREFLRGERDGDMITLLRKAAEEIQQLDCAARLALGARSPATIVSGGPEGASCDTAKP